MAENDPDAPRSPDPDPWARTQMGMQTSGGDRQERDAGRPDPAGPGPAGPDLTKRANPADGGQAAQPVEGRYAPGQYGQDQYGAGQYGAGQYGPGQYGGPPYGQGDASYGPGGYDAGRTGADSQGVGQYGAEQYGAGQYGAAPYGAQQYGPGQYGATQYGAGEYGPGTPYGPGPQQQYPGPDPYAMPPAPAVPQGSRPGALIAAAIVQLVVGVLGGGFFLLMRSLLWEMAVDNGGGRYRIGDAGDLYSRAEIEQIGAVIVGIAVVFFAVAAVSVALLVVGSNGVRIAATVVYAVSLFTCVGLVTAVIAISLLWAPESVKRYYNPGYRSY